MLVITYDHRNQEVEYYLYDRLQAPVHLDADDFNPDKVWNNPKSAKAKPKAAPKPKPTPTPNP